jgi:hypothetical protein
MSNAYNATLARVATRPWGGYMTSTTPLATGGDRFEVVVEGRAGVVLATSGQPYTIEIVAFDITAGVNPHSALNNFTQRITEQFDVADGWPYKVAVFTVTLNNRDAVQGHLLKYYATLMSQNQVASFVESPIFLLFTAEAEIHRAYGWREIPSHRAHEEELE